MTYYINTDLIVTALIEDRVLCWELMFVQLGCHFVITRTRVDVRLSNHVKSRRFSFFFLTRRWAICQVSAGSFCSLCLQLPHRQAESWSEKRILCVCVRVCVAGCVGGGRGGGDHSFHRRQCRTTTRLTSRNVSPLTAQRWRLRAWQSISCESFRISVTPQSWLLATMQHHQPPLNITPCTHTHNLLHTKTKARALSILSLSIPPNHPTIKRTTKTEFRSKTIPQVTWIIRLQKMFFVKSLSIKIIFLKSLCYDITRVS